MQARKTNPPLRSKDKTTVDGVTTTVAARTVMFNVKPELADALDSLFIRAGVDNISAMATMAYLIGVHLAHASAETSDGDAEWVKDGLKEGIELIYQLTIKQSVIEDEKCRKRT